MPALENTALKFAQDTHLRGANCALSLSCASPSFAVSVNTLKWEQGPLARPTPALAVRPEHQQDGPEDGVCVFRLH